MPAKNAIAGRFGHRLRFSCYRRLVDRRGTAGDAAVGGESFARQHCDAISGYHVGSLDNLLTAIAHDPRLGGRLIQQRPNRTAGSFKTVFLESLANRKQDNHGRRLDPLIYRHRAQDGDAHQNVDIERPGTPNGANASAGYGITADRNGHGEGRPPCPVRRSRQRHDRPGG